ncbi:MAG: hypothetical protein RLY71_358 [Pseudomonadota bacterium]|jgi:ribonuclease T2
MRFLFVACVCLAAGSVQASELATGVFTASTACDAYSSFGKKTNPGAVKVEVGKAYQITELNQINYEWLHVTVPNVPQPSARWVAASCGTVTDLKTSSGALAAPAIPLATLCKTPDLYDSHVLAVTWQPGFCEYKVAADTTKPECAALSQGTLKSTNLTLHGLWPNKKECGINYGYCSDVPLNLAPETIARISLWMPNFLYSTDFGSYEWKKHGTCQTALDDDGYFLKAVAAIEAVNASALGNFILQSVGQKVSKADLVNAVRTDNPAAVGSVAFLCSGSNLYEIRISLGQQFTTDAGLAGLVGSTPQAIPSQGEECPDLDINIEASGV